jgi:glycosyltransferase involved in cell wall biosynthesis
VVATNVDGLPEVVQDGVSGRLVEPAAPARLAAAVLDVLDHHEQMAAAAAENARRFFVQDYTDHVERLINP